MMRLLNGRLLTNRSMVAMSLPLIILSQRNKRMTYPVPSPSISSWRAVSMLVSILSTMSQFVFSFLPIQIKN